MIARRNPHQATLANLDARLQRLQNLAGGVYMAAQALGAQCEREPLTAIAGLLNGEIIGVRAAVAQARVASAPVAPPPIAAPRPANMDWNNLASLYDALRTIEDVCSGLGCQPRFQDAAGGYDPAGTYLNDLSVVIAQAADDIARRAMGASAGDPDGMHKVALADEVRIFDGVEEIAALACRLSGQLR